MYRTSLLPVSIKCIQLIYYKYRKSVITAKIIHSDWKTEFIRRTIICKVVLLSNFFG